MLVWRFFWLEANQSLNCGLLLTFLPNWQPPLIFVWFISNFLCLCSNSLCLCLCLLSRLLLSTKTSMIFSDVHTIGDLSSAWVAIDWEKKLFHHFDKMSFHAQIMSCSTNKILSQCCHLTPQSKSIAIPIIVDH